MTRRVGTLVKLTAALLTFPSYSSPAVSVAAALPFFSEPPSPTPHTQRERERVS